MRTLPKDIYPWTPKRWDRGQGIEMSYLDEGPRDGAPIVMVHGNPTWSIYYRRLVGALRGPRMIVPDHVGMGLSDKPSDARYDYTLASRVDDLTRLLAHLIPTGKVSLVAHDWGGMIAMAWATAHPERVERIALMNTAAFPMPNDMRFPGVLRFTRTPVGSLMVRGGNAFALGASHLCTTRQPMPRAVRRAYRAPYDTWAHRIATLRFVQDIPLDPRDASYAIVERTGQRLELLRDVPFSITWGEKDFIFGDAFLREWERRVPHADVLRIEDAGHYVIEDAPEEVVPRLVRFLTP
jgi:haloalkane dehalogenase